MHLVVNVNSRECEPELLSRLAGAEHFPERSLGWSILATARDTNRETIIFIAPDIHDRDKVIDYYCRLATDNSSTATAELRSRIDVITLSDSSGRWLSDKLVQDESEDAILARRRIRERAQACREDGGNVSLDYFEPSKNLEAFAETLVSLPSQAHSTHIPKGRKAYARDLFTSLDIPVARGTRLRRDIDDLAPEILDLQDRFSLHEFVLKLNGSEYAAGYGNAFVTVQRGPERDRITALQEQLNKSLVVDKQLGWAGFVADAKRSGVLAEERLKGDEFRSPSFQGRIEESGEVVAVSSHEQHFTEDGTGFVGCSYPADSDYRSTVIEHGLTVGRELAARGVERGGYGVDFMALRDRPSDGWRVFGCEINLRDTGTKHPFETASALLGEPIDGRFSGAGGSDRVYLCSDSIYKPAYRGKVRPGALIEAVERTPNLHFDHASRTGVVLHMFGSLFTYGKIGATYIAADLEHAKSLQDELERLLDALCST